MATDEKLDISRDENVSATELKEFLTGHMGRLRLLKNCLIGLIVFVVLVMIGHAIYYYNYLTSLKFDMLASEANVCSSLQYRVNLVPVLVESVARFVDHEDDVFNRAVDARERSLTSSGPSLEERLRQATQGTFEETLQKIMAIAEQYPDLKTSDPFQLLMTTVTEAESKIMELRIKYNELVNQYTTARKKFPGNVYSAVFGFHEYDYFTSIPGSEWPEVRVKTERGMPARQAQDDGGETHGNSNTDRISQSQQGELESATSE